MLSLPQLVRSHSSSLLRFDHIQEHLRAPSVAHAWLKGIERLSCSLSGQRTTRAVKRLRWSVNGALVMCLCFFYKVIAKELAKAHNHFPGDVVRWDEIWAWNPRLKFCPLAKLRASPRVWPRPSFSQPAGHR